MILNHNYVNYEIYIDSTNIVLVFLLTLKIDTEYKQVEYFVFIVHSLGIGVLLWCVDAKDEYLRITIKNIML